MAGQTTSIGKLALTLIVDASGVRPAVNEANRELGRVGQPSGPAGGGRAAGSRLSGTPIVGPRFGGPGAGGPSIPAFGPRGPSAASQFGGLFGGMLSGRAGALIPSGGSLLSLAGSAGRGLLSGAGAVAGVAGPLAVAGLAAASAGAASALYGLKLAAEGAWSIFTDILEKGGELQKQEAAFGVLAGSPGRGASLLGEVQKYAIESPFKVMDLTNQVRLLLSYGVAADDVMGVLKQIGDVASGTGVEMNRLALAYGQVVAKGRLQGPELRQLTEAGVSVADIAKAAGVSVSEFLGRMEEGRISAYSMVKAFEQMTSEGGRFYGMSARQMATLPGQLMQLQEAWEVFTSRVGKLMIEKFNLVPFLQRVNSELQKIGSPEGMASIALWLGKAAPIAERVENSLYALGRTVVQIGTGLAGMGPEWKSVDDVFRVLTEKTLPGLIQMFQELLKVTIKIGIASAEFGKSMTDPAGNLLRSLPGGKSVELGMTAVGWSRGNKMAVYDATINSLKALDAKFSKDSESWGGMFLKNLRDEQDRAAGRHLEDALKPALSGGVIGFGTTLKTVEQLGQEARARQAADKARGIKEYEMSSPTMAGLLADRLRDMKTGPTPEDLINLARYSRGAAALDIVTPKGRERVLEDLFGDITKGIGEHAGELPTTLLKGSREAEAAMSRVLNRGATPDVQKMVVDKLNQVQERLKEANIQRQKLIDALMNTRQVMQKDGTVRFESGPNPWGYQFPPPGPFSAGNPWAYQK